MADIYNLFTYKTSGNALTSDNDFITMATGTILVKDSGIQYKKISTNVFNRNAVNYLTAEQDEDKFGHVEESNTWTGSDNHFTQDVTIDGATEVGSLVVDGKAEVGDDLTVKGDLVVNGSSTFDTITANTGNITTINATSLNPKSNNTGSIGTSSLIWATAYINNIYGTINHAKYSDLAEKYSVDADYPYGTVLQINTNGDAMLTKFDGGTLAGVVSMMPGYRMNSELIEGQYVALKGMIPVLVESDVKKGQYVVASSGGKAKGIDKDDLTIANYLDIIGIALKDSTDGKVLTKV